ncbi:hypothetical protein L7F22_060773 [Adiantum nelumboides]|nr:hypothetical protein [Adiantum nelumboides]
MACVLLDSCAPCQFWRGKRRLAEEEGRLALKEQLSALEKEPDPRLKSLKAKLKVGFLLLVCAHNSTQRPICIKFFTWGHLQLLREKFVDDFNNTEEPPSADVCTFVEHLCCKVFEYRTEADRIWLFNKACIALHSMTIFVLGNGGGVEIAKAQHTGAGTANFWFVHCHVTCKSNS